MYQRSMMFVTALIVSSAAALVSAPAEAVIVRYESALQVPGGGFWRGYDRLVATEVFSPPSGGESSLFGSYLNFEIDTETGEVTNYFIEFQNYTFGNGRVTFDAGTPDERVVDYSDSLGQQEILPAFATTVPGASIPLTRILFLRNNGGRELGFLLELEGDLFANTTGGQVDISPFRPGEPLSNGRTPAEFGSLLIPLSTLGTSRTGSFGVALDDAVQFAAFGATADDLGQNGGVLLLGEVVPEPGSLALLAAGGLLFAGRRRRRDEESR